MRRYKIVIAYDGTHYSGWQVQKNSISIQSLIQKALEVALRHPLDLTGSGRTDAGVHARGQIAHFNTAIPLDLVRLRISLNALLPPDIRILEILPTHLNFHSRYSAIGKIYHYHLHLDPVLDPFTKRYCHHVLGPFDREKLKMGASEFIGTHDFTSFANLRACSKSRFCQLKDGVRKIKRIDIIEQKGGIRLEFEGNGFLYKMVRNLVGTLLEVAAGKIQSTELAEILNKKDRRKAGFSAPAQGLFLMKVIYPLEFE